MIAFDTNVVVRLVVEDDAEQLHRVHQLIASAEAESENVLIPDVVLCELEWVLTSAYGATRGDVLAAVQALAAEPLFAFEDRDRLRKVLDTYERGRGDLSDYLIGARAAAAGARTTYSFDRALRGDAGFTVSPS